MEKNRPNLLFVMVDQLRYDCLGANGNRIVQTPNLDLLAREGVNARQYFTNCPVCVPSRTTLFTGRYPHSHKIRENHTLIESGAEMHLFRVLKQEGYRIGYVGKNHLLNDEEFGNFDYADLEPDLFSLLQDKPFYRKYSDAELEYWRFGKERHMKMEENGAYAGTGRHNIPEEFTEPRVFTDSAIQFMQDHSQTHDQPFCLCLSLLMPHAPHIAPEAICALYDDADIEPPQSDIQALKEKANRYYVKYLAQKSDRASREDKINFIAMYYAMVTAVDRQIGRLMGALSSFGLDENTIVVFTSDHGDFLFDYGMCKKDLVMTDCLLRVPLIIRHKGTLAPRVLESSFIEQVDLLPTLLEMLGVDAPLGVQGRSALPFIAGETARHKREVFGEICAPWQYNPYHTYDDMRLDWRERFDKEPPINVPGDFTKSIRTNSFRYVWYSSGEEELYDLKNDPGEINNVARFSEYAAAKIEHKLRLLEWLAMSEDPLDPKINAKNQARYRDWIGAKRAEKADGGPYWLEQIADSPSPPARGPKLDGK